MERHWERLAACLSAAGRDVLHPARLPDEWLAPLCDAVHVVLHSRGDDARHEAAFALLCAIVFRLRREEWRHRQGGVYVSLKQLWQAIENYGARLEVERALRIAEGRLRRLAVV